MTAANITDVADVTAALLHLVPDPNLSGNLADGAGRIPVPVLGPGHSPTASLLCVLEASKEAGIFARFDARGPIRLGNLKKGLKLTIYLGLRRSCDVAVCPGGRDPF